MKYLLLIIVIAIALTSYNEADSSDYPYYNIKLSIDPEEKYIEVDCYLDIPACIRSNTIHFYLHEQLLIEEMKINENESFTFSKDSSDIRYMPCATRYSLKTQGLKNKNVTLHVKYSGRITQWPDWSASVIGEEWTEMGCYFPWYPYCPDYRPFTYRVEVFTDDDYRPFMMGSETLDDRWALYRTESPTNDIVFCASKAVKTVKKEIYQYKVSFAYSTLSTTLIDTITSDLRKILALYNTWYPPGGKRLCIVESMRDKGGGYARLGGIYLPGLTGKEYHDSRNAYTRYLSHELSHLWWYRANSNTWEDWLNEGFAEYSALMVLRELYGQDYFDKWLKKKKEKSEGTDPVWLYDRNGQQAYTILYDKTPLLLNELENRMGPDQFKRLLWDILKNDVSTTYQFMNVLENLEGKETKEWFIEKLKS